VKDGKKHLSWLCPS